MRNRRGLKLTELEPRNIPLLYIAFHLPGQRPPSPSLEGLCQGSLVATAEACYGTRLAALAAVPPFLWPKGTMRKAEASIPTMSETTDLKVRVNIQLAVLETKKEHFKSVQRASSQSSTLVTFQMDDAECGKFHCICFLI